MPWQSMLALSPCHCEEGARYCADAAIYARSDKKMKVVPNLYSSTASGPPSPLFEKEERRLEVSLNLEIILFSCTTIFNLIYDIIKKYIAKLH